MSFKKQVTNWFFKNEEYIAPKTTKAIREKGYKKCLKDLKADKNSLREKYWNFLRTSIINGTIKPQSYVNISIDAEKSVTDLELKVWRPVDDKYDPTLFEAWETGLGIDILLSNKGGATKASTTIITGVAGVGKTTVAANIQKRLQENYPDAKIACVQAEMKKNDIKYEVHENDLDWMKDLNYILLSNYGYENVKNVLIKVFSSGYDIIFLDSIEKIVGQLVAYTGMTRKESEKFILELFDNANDGRGNFNEKGEPVLTTVFAIQQVTKGGNFVGGNGLLHETTGLLHFDYDGSGRYCKPLKNRRCGSKVGKKLYYELQVGENGEKEIHFDVKLFDETEEKNNLINDEKKKIEEDAETFFERIQSVSENDTDEEDIENLFTETVLDENN